MGNNDPNQRSQRDLRTQKQLAAVQKQERPLTSNYATNQVPSKQVYMKTGVSANQMGQHQNPVAMSGQQKPKMAQSSSKTSNLQLNSRRKPVSQSTFDIQGK